MTEQQKTYAGLIARLRRAAPAAGQGTAVSAAEPAAGGETCPYHGDAVLREFVRAFLHADAPSPRADAAARRLERAIVDVNELRVCLPDEIARMIGPSLAGADDRARRLRLALNAIYKREHRVTLAHLADRAKREAREYLEKLDGVSHYVWARTAVLALGGHAVPLDDRLLAALRDEGIFDARTPFEDAASWLDRNTRAGECAEVHRLLTAWLDDGARTAAKAPAKPAAKAARKPGAKPAGNKTVAAGKPARTKPAASKSASTRPRAAKPKATAERRRG